MHQTWWWEGESARAVQAPHEDDCGALKVFERHVSCLSIDGGGSWTAVEAVVKRLGAAPLNLVLLVQTVFVGSSQQVWHAASTSTARRAWAWVGRLRCAHAQAPRPRSRPAPVRCALTRIEYTTAAAGTSTTGGAAAVHGDRVAKH